MKHQEFDPLRVDLGCTLSNLSLGIDMFASLLAFSKQAVEYSLVWLAAVPMLSSLKTAATETTAIVS
jgi:hypothetical protein